MDVEEQTQLQLWLDGLLMKLEGGEVEDVKQQLKIALGRIEEEKDGNHKRLGSTVVSETGPAGETDVEDPGSDPYNTGSKISPGTSGCDDEGSTSTE